MLNVGLKKYTRFTHFALFPDGVYIMEILLNVTFNCISSLHVLQLCLEEMDYNIEKVINAVLEDKLPPSLQNMDRNLERYCHF